MLREVDLGVFEEHWRVNVSPPSPLIIPFITYVHLAFPGTVADPSKVLGYLAFFQACVPLMQKGGKFIFISSGSATIDQVPRGYEVTYGISKVSGQISATLKLLTGHLISERSKLSCKLIVSRERVIY
jgi:NAD(P)-dependent dehydrogenase (short-subunit alcohol dehydrogenase family)